MSKEPVSNEELQSDIEHLRQTLSDISHKWSCAECRQDHERLLRELEELQERRLRDK